MNIYIKEEEVKEAKELRDKLDSVKKHEKFKCSNNYIGVLGEIVLHRYLTEKNISHKWIQFIQEGKGWNEPDFIFNEKTIDLKTTKGEDMWFQKPKHDIYIHAQINEDDTVLTVDGMATRDILNRMIEDGTAKIVKRGTRQDYVVSPMDMIPVTLMWGN